MPTEYKYEAENDTIDEIMAMKKMKMVINQITSLLNSFDKEYEVKYWDSGEGVDIIVKEYDADNDKDYYQTIRINDTGYLNFEKQEEKDG